jgi:hypothetical protein
MEEAIAFNIQNGKPLTECIFRRESDKFVEYFKYLKENKSKLELGPMDIDMLETDIGEKGLFEGNEVFLDLPFIAEAKADEDPCWTGYVMVGMKKNEKGRLVPNCVPEDSVNEEDKENVELNKPKRNGGAGKKYYVYTKNDKGNVIKVSFGDVKGGLTAKISDPEARKNFASRHNCDQKKDRTKAGYWACRLPYYAKELGLSSGGNFFW